MLSGCQVLQSGEIAKRGVGSDFEGGIVTTNLYYGSRYDKTARRVYVEARSHDVDFWIEEDHSVKRGYRLRTEYPNKGLQLIYQGPIEHHEPAILKILITPHEPDSLAIRGEGTPKI